MKNFYFLYFSCCKFYATWKSVCCCGFCDAPTTTTLRNVLSMFLNFLRTYDTANKVVLTHTNHPMKWEDVCGSSMKFLYILPTASWLYYMLILFNMRGFISILTYVSCLKRLHGFLSWYDLFYIRIKSFMSDDITRTKDALTYFHFFSFKYLKQV